jgi:hypothetical protein
MVPTWLNAVQLARLMVPLAAVVAVVVAVVVPLKKVA